MDDGWVRIAQTVICVYIFYLGSNRAIGIHYYDKRHMKKTNKTRYGDLIGNCQAMRRIYKKIEKAARYDIPVLITGATGTGKDMVAREIHRASNKKDELFYPVNMGAIPKELIGSTLFGHEKGAFTGATTQKKGMFETADGGTLFLDEIGTMDEQTQVSLLRVIEDGKVRRVGGSTYHECNVRLIGATNTDLRAAVQNRTFREDLFYRLNVFKLDLPPLRSRGSDIVLLADVFAERYAEEFGKEFTGMSTDVVSALKDYLWPGNVRELENVIIRAMLATEDGNITVEQLTGEIENDVAAHEHPVIEAGMTLEEAEKELIRLTLEKVNGSKSEAARMLGISRKGFYNKLKKHGF
jgi:DNA-binding NtrC family response regulator